ncbi:hypothetical protein NP233_g5742 [Leucocoprinus birnbaumii]|uniref:Amidohydrolase-related domain-containing protein n=1 Tax=Leucocoprinus birnbaumii TaxID=56174 RepID=A0AAD5VUZ0_9AGAR|nr:hypothetical protein NP233_g5742 [Leucocoprinus birnbaumii]
MFSKRILWSLALLACLYPFFYRRHFQSLVFGKDYSQAPPHIQVAINQCLALQQKPGPLPGFWSRSRSDRYEPGTKPVLIKRGKIWTGKDNGTQVIHGDILMEEGIIKSIGKLGWMDLDAYGGDLQIIDAKGSWITPGLVDVHSHLGDFPLPNLEGSNDGNSMLGIVQPWLRSLDALNTHDETYPLVLAGGVTTSLVLPGSANAIGGQAFVIKLRETSEKSPSSMLVERPYQANETHLNSPPRWRYIKHACGENPSSSFKGTRMDTIWAFREAYAKARQIKEDQDRFCSNVLNGNGENLSSSQFPEDLKWEALVDVLRGRVKVNTHCYEAVDIDDFVRLTNEFEFPVAAFHHASEAYLVPDVLKRAYGNTPAIALFATFARYKREAYRSSEFAPRILAQNGITSDHPAAVDARHLIYEAQQAFFYGLPHNLALASVTSNAAETLGLGHRLGYIREGWDADVVIWDSHPLALGATPTQVFVDGVPQFSGAIKTEKPDNYQQVPRVPNFDKDAQEAVEYDGLPPLEPKKKTEETVVFTNVQTVYRPNNYRVKREFTVKNGDENGVVVVKNGRIICSGGQQARCLTDNLLADPKVTLVDLKGGSISPGLVSYGSNLGLEEITFESSTTDGLALDSLLKPIPKILGGDFLLLWAADGLQFGTRGALLAYRYGVTSAVTAPAHQAFAGGLGVAFSLGALNKMEKNAVIQDVTSLHVSVGHFTKPSVSSQIAALRRLLLGPPSGEVGAEFEKVKQGRIPLVVEAHNADIIATLLILKAEFEANTKNQLRLTITGATEAHLLAKEIAEAGVGVILAPSRPLPKTWEKRRIAPGPPVTNETALSHLLRHNVTVGIGSEHVWSTRNLVFDLAWASIEAGGAISKEQAMEMGSVNIDKLLGVDRSSASMDLVVTRRGDLLDFGSEVVAILSPEAGTAHKSSQGASDAKVKQITDFFPRKSTSLQGSSSNATRTKNTKHGSAKENTTPAVHPKTQTDNGPSSFSSAPSAPQRAVSPIPARAVPQVASPMQPPTKRSRSHSTAATQPTKQAKRSKNILCEPMVAEDMMDVDENSVVFVPTAFTAPINPSPFLPVPASDPRKTISPDRDSEISLVPSSVSDEKELDRSLAVERKDAGAVKDTVDHWRQEALPPSPMTSASSPIEPRAQAQSAQSDWTMSIDAGSSATPSRRNASSNASIPTPPSTDGPEDTMSMSPVKVLDPETKTQQIIAEIRARAFAQARPSAEEPSSPLFDIASIDSSDDEGDEYDSLAMLGLRNNAREKSPVKVTSPVKQPKYNLRKPKAEANPKPLFPTKRDTSPSPPARRKPAANPLETLLKEKRAAEAKSTMTSAEREARLRRLEAMNLNDFDDNKDLTADPWDGPSLGTDDENPFLDDVQKREVRDIFKGDKDIEDEEEHLRQQGSVGVTLWSKKDPDVMDVPVEDLPSLEYQGSDPTLQTFAETVAHGDCGLTRLLMQSGVLEMADYSGKGLAVIEYFIRLAFSHREDDLDLSALRLIPHVLSNGTVVSPVLTFDNILSTLCDYGVDTSVLDQLGWIKHNPQCHSASSHLRSEVLQRLAFCIADITKVGCLHRREIPDIVAVLLLIGIEPSTSQEFRLQITRIIHAVCQSSGQESTIETDLECAITNKVLQLIQPYSVQNKLYAVELLATGSGRTARIARSIAHALLTDKSALLPSQYSSLPPISELLDMLNISSPDAAQPLGKFEYHEATDYVDMASWAAILAIAVTDVASYMELEKSSRQPVGSLIQTPQTILREEESIFDTLHQRLKKVHDRISDSRAAHLDRSNVKAILIHTNLRILYQSQAIAQYRRKRSGKIHNYMSRK